MHIRTVETEIADTIFAGKLHCLQQVESTNTLAAQAAQQGASEGTLFIADEQTAGRGRGGHSWHSEPHAGLYFSFVLRPNMRPHDALWISLAAGVAVHHAIKHVTGLDVDLRWPNDLLIGRKKFCGILTELQSRNTHVEHAIVGIGINVNHTSFPPDLRDIATSLGIAAGRELPREHILAAVLRAFDDEYKSLNHRGPEPLLTQLQQASTWIRGKHVHVPEQGGYTGVTCGLNAQGFLLVQTDTGVLTVMSGGVREVE
jgi:BirA family transcriptional regulator, biotin operon repressor / biotin---[acetyl-CoA-carboxylase] ligase